VSIAWRTAPGPIGEGDTGEFGIGNLEFGGLYQRVINPGFALGLRAGLILPASTGNDLVNLASTLIARPGDIATTVPGTWLRLGISPTFHAGTGFMRLDAGLDIPVASENSPDSIAHVNVGAGFSADRWSVTAELGMVRVSSGWGSDTFTVAGLAVHYRGESAALYIMLSAPVDQPRDDKIVTPTVGAAF
jgi:hypothetical protein